MTFKCDCEDSNGHVCGKPLTYKEVKQDGVCSNCADNLAIWINNPKHQWSNVELTPSEGRARRRRRNV